MNDDKRMQENTFLLYGYSMDYLIGCYILVAFGCIAAIFFLLIAFEVTPMFQTVENGAAKWLCVGFLLFTSIWTIWFGIIKIRRRQKQYVIFTSEGLEVHHYDEVEHFPREQLTRMVQMNYKVVRGGDREIYQLFFPGDRCIEVVKDARVLAYFPGVEAPKMDKWVSGY